MVEFLGRETMHISYSVKPRSAGWTLSVHPEQKKSCPIWFRKCNNQQYTTIFTKRCVVVLGIGIIMAKDAGVCDKRWKLCKSGLVFKYFHEHQNAILDRPHVHILSGWS